MLGMGVHRVWRRRGLGRRLLEAAAGWARAETDVDWIDLEVLSENLPAIELYARAGFTTVARVADMLRIAGTSHDLSYMTFRLRRK
jgi:ribosomal protein S18 acetylase RimI-like enzyme